MRKVHGFPEIAHKYWPLDVDFYVLSNEDIGFEAILTHGANDVYNFALPYPATVNLSEETIVIYALEFLWNDIVGDSISATQYALMVSLSFLDKDYAATFEGAAVDAEDEALKSKFASRMIIGEILNNYTATVNISAIEHTSDQTAQVIYFPPTPLDLATPLFVDFVNNTQTSTLGTGNRTKADFVAAKCEKVGIRVWFKKRRLTSTEKAVRNSGMRFMRLDA